MMPGAMEEPGFYEFQHDQTGGPAPALAQEAACKVVEWEMKLRVLEGEKEGLAAVPSVVTSTFLKYTFSANFRSDEELTKEETQIKRIFNLKDVKLLTEGGLNWKAGMPPKVTFVFRLDGREYSIQVRGSDFITKEKAIGTQSFGIEVLEQQKAEAKEKIKEAGSPVFVAKIASLLDTEFTVSSLKNVTVFGFEDSQGRPYFISLQQTKMYAEEPDEGGAKGGVAGGVVGGLASKEPAPDVKPPKLVKMVEPVYPVEAKKAGISGIVVVEAAVDVNGRVVNVKILKSIPGLDQAALDAVKQWVYEPMLVNGKPRPVVFSTTIRFVPADEGTGVSGGVEGGVEGGIVGGVEGGVLGGVEGGVTEVSPAAKAKAMQEREEFEKGAVRAIGDIKPPRLIKAVEPVYPEIARQAQVEGVVIVEARTDEKGNVEDARILRSIPLLEQAAIDAVKQWKYEPAIINGKPQKVVFTVTVRFMLKTGNKEKDLERFAQGAVKAEGAIPPPKLIKVVDPVYPEIARQAKVEGVVILSAKTDATGHVQDVMILRSIPLLNQAALDAVRQWVYEPLVINGVAKPVVFTVTVRFQLPEKDKTKKDL